MQTLPKNIRITPEDDEKINKAVERTGLTKAEVMRAALRLGLEDLLLVKKTPMERLEDEIRAAKVDPSNFVSGDPDATKPMISGLADAERPDAQKQG